MQAAGCTPAVVVEGTTTAGAAGAALVPVGLHETGGSGPTCGRQQAA